MGALGDPYITAADLTEYLGISDAEDETLLEPVCVAVTESIDQFCQRQFNNTTTSTDRTYRPRDWYCVKVDDFHTTTGLVIATDTSDDGTYDTVWAATDYELEPADGIEHGVTGFPYSEIRAVESKRFHTCGYRRQTVQVTAQWGWAAVPESVTLAAKLLAAFYYNLKNSPLGVASFADNGLIRVRDVPQAGMLLAPFVNPALTGPLVA